MIILGIDPGTARMGCGVIHFKKKNVVEFVRSDVLVTPMELEAQDRLKMLYKGIKQIVAEYSPDVMVVEKLFFNTNVKTAMTVGQARGIALLVASEKKLKFREYTALEAKLMVTGYGRSDKKQMQQAVMEKLHLPSIIKSDDANDAVAMGLCYVLKELC
jgi:crossover junction endodeoxyribonuclease RuvC